MKELNLLKEYYIIIKSQPALANDFIEEYCAIAKEPGINKKYFFGYNSLKWVMHQIFDIDKLHIRNIFYGILCDLKLNFITEDDIQFNILRAFPLRQYRVQLKNLPPIADIQMFETFSAGGYTFTFNQTKFNLTSKIFNYTKTDAVIHIDPEFKAASITFQTHRKINQLEGFKQYLLENFTEIEPGWKILGDENNRIVNLGVKEGNESNISTWKFQEIIQHYFNE